MTDSDGHIWTVAGNSLILDIPKLLLSLDLPDTLENRDLAIKTTLEVAREVVPDILPLAVIGIVPRRWGWNHE